MKYTPEQFKKECEGAERGYVIMHPDAESSKIDRKANTYYGFPIRFRKDCPEGNVTASHERVANSIREIMEMEDRIEEMVKENYEMSHPETKNEDVNYPAWVTDRPTKDDPVRVVLGNLGITERGSWVNLEGLSKEEIYTGLTTISPDGIAYHGPDPEAWASGALDIEEAEKEHHKKQKDMDKLFRVSCWAGDHTLAISKYTFAKDRATVLRSMDHLIGIELSDVETRGLTVHIEVEELCDESEILGPEQ